MKQCGKMVKLNLHALYSDLTVVYKLIQLCICQQQSGIWCRITVDRHFNASRMCMWGHTAVQTNFVIIASCLMCVVCVLFSCGAAPQRGPWPPQS